VHPAKSTSNEPMIAPNTAFCPMAVNHPSWGGPNVATCLVQPTLGTPQRAASSASLCPDPEKVLRTWLESSLSSLDMLHLQVGCAAKFTRAPATISSCSHESPAVLRPSGLGDCPNNRILSRALNRCLQVYTRPSLKRTVLICA
jgi:hypothetical protein